MPMRLLLLEQIELVQEQAVVERAGSAGGLVEEPSLTGPAVKPQARLAALGNSTPISRSGSLFQAGAFIPKDF